MTEPFTNSDWKPGATGYVRLRNIIAPDGPLPIGRSTFWAWVKDGRFPKPTKLGPKISAWRVEEVRQALAVMSEAAK